MEELADGRVRVTVSYRDDEAPDVWVIGGLAGLARVRVEVNGVRLFFDVAMDDVVGFETGNRA